MKMKLREKVSKASSYLEIAISVVILLSISVSLIFLVKDTVIAILDVTKDFDYTNLFAVALQLIIGVEFVKMLSKHTPESVIEVLLFVVAKRVIVDSNSSSLEVLWGVVAIAALYAVKKFLVEAQPKKTKADSEDKTAIQPEEAK